MGYIRIVRATRLDLDRIGAVASGICAVHCLVTGVAFGLLSVLGLGFLGSVPAEVAFISVALTIGTTAVVLGYRKHHSRVPAMLFCGGLVCVLVSHLVFGDGQVAHPSSIPGTTFAVLGGLMLVAFHFVNQRLQCTH